MQYDLARAQILLRDLEDIGQGQVPISQLTRSTDGVAAVTGTCTRMGLLRMGVRLAKAAIRAESTVSIDADGFVYSNSIDGGDILQLFLIEDRPVESPPRSSWRWILVRPSCLPDWDWVSMTAQLIIAALLAIGIFTVVRWLVGALA